MKKFSHIPIFVCVLCVKEVSPPKTSKTIEYDMYIVHQPTPSDTPDIYYWGFINYARSIILFDSNLRFLVFTFNFRFQHSCFAHMENNDNRY